MADEKKIIEIKVELTDGVKEIGRLVSIIDALNAEQKENTKVTEEQQTKYAQNTVALREYRAQLSTMVRETRNEIKATNEKLGYIQQLKAQVSNLTLEYERLTQAELQGDKGAQVLTNLKAKRDELSNLEQAYGNYTRNVGNYSSATNNLAINLGMVMKELPNFAISARIGIMSLTNNLPMLAEAIKAVRVQQSAMVAEGKAVPSMFSLITKSIFGLTGIVSIAMILLQIFGGEIVKWAKDAIVGETAADRLAKANDRLNKSYENSKRVMGERMEIMRLMGENESKMIHQNIIEENNRFFANEGRELAGLKNDLSIGKKLSKQRKKRYDELIEMEAAHNNTIESLQSDYRVALAREDIDAKEQLIKNQEQQTEEMKKLAWEQFNAQYDAKKELDALLKDIQASQKTVATSLSKNIDTTLDNLYKKAVEIIPKIKDLLAGFNKRMQDDAIEDSERWTAQMRKRVDDAVYYADIELATLETNGQASLIARMNLLKAQEDAEINSAITNERETEKIRAYYAARRREVEREEFAASLQATSKLMGSIASLWEESSSEHKIFATAEAVMNTYLGVTNALAQTKGGIVAQVAGAGAALVAGLAAVKKIWSVNVKNPSISGGLASFGSVPPDTTSKMGSPLAQQVSSITPFGGSSTIASGASTSVSTGSNDMMKVMQNLPPQYVTVKDIDIATKRVKVIDSIAKVE